MKEGRGPLGTYTAPSRIGIESDGSVGGDPDLQSSSCRSSLGNDNGGSRNRGCVSRSCHQNRGSGWDSFKSWCPLQTGERGSVGV